MTDQIEPTQALQGEDGGASASGFDPSRIDHAAIEASAQIVEEHGGEMSYLCWEATKRGDKIQADFYHRRFEMLCAMAARIRSQISSEHVIATALMRPGAARWSSIIAGDQIKGLSDSEPPRKSAP